jgi:hypothetical protein
MANPKDGITELVKTLALLASKLDKKTYEKVVSTIFALLNGVQFGYTEMGPRFINDAHDIYDLHSKGPKKKKIKNNVIPFKLIKGGKDDK